ncbi:MAG: hypothetical protein JXJ22_01045 [Bacteroidales bacterium]|nr:hypothetical protein [Bacteroidales bacterium]
MDYKKHYIKIFIALGIFSMAMAYLESAVVVYLRALMYPGGFNFPFAPMDPDIAVTEIIREAATLVMLLGAAFIAGKKPTERFAWFLYCFAIWDIFYYVFLKLLLDWPESLMTDDILFLIPATWVGPVITPIILSLIMIGFTVLIISFYQKGIHVRINWQSWSLLVIGSLIDILAFIWDYSKFMLRFYSFSEILRMKDKTPLYNLAQKYIPGPFNWLLFITGTLIIIGGIIIFFVQHSKKNVSS